MIRVFALIGAYFVAWFLIGVSAQIAAYLAQ